MGGIFREDPNRPHCAACDYPMKRNRGKAQSGRQRYTCSKCGVSTTGSPDSAHEGQLLGYDRNMAKQRARDLRTAIRGGANRFVITSAVNNTPVHPEAWQSLLNLCADRSAHMVVIPIHYKNVTLYTPWQEYSKVWAPEVQPYLIDEAIRLNRQVVVRADVSIQATAAQPLDGMAPLAGEKWAIFGHSQMGMEPIPTPLDQLPGRMYTTGAVTKPSYSKTKVGAKAKFHHVIGALLVEVQGKNAWIRQLNVDSTGCVYELDCRYGPSGITRDCSALSVTTGDEHVRWFASNVMMATYTKSDSLVNYMRPCYLVRHDVLDGYAGSHFHVGDYAIEFRKWLKGYADYREELDGVVDHINRTTPTKWHCENVIIKDSNHHDHLNRWLRRADDRTDHLNAELICELRNEQRKAIREGRDWDAFELYVKPRLEVPAIFVQPQKSFFIGGVDHSQHGHRGVNGTRGTARALANTTHKATVGHSHSARIVKGIYQVGKSCGTLEYEAGLSSHTNTHVLQYENGKRTLIDIIGWNWRATNIPNAGGLKIDFDFS